MKAEGELLISSVNGYDLHIIMKDFKERAPLAIMFMDKYYLGSGVGSNLKGKHICHFEMVLNRNSFYIHR